MAPVAAVTPGLALAKLVQPNIEPKEFHQRQWVVDRGWNHGHAPSHRCDRGACYLVWSEGGME